MGFKIIIRLKTTIMDSAIKKFYYNGSKHQRCISIMIQNSNVL